MRLFVACAVLSVLVAACPTPGGGGGGGGEGEGEGAAEGEGGGEGGGEGEGEGEGEGDVAPTGTLIVAGEGLNLEDARRDGAEIAYRDADDTLFSVSADGGEATQIDDAINRAEYHGIYLVALRSELGGTPGTFASGFISPALPSSAGDLGDLVRSKSLDSSPDGQHLYYELVNDSVAQTEDLYLDGTLIVTAASKEKTRFTFDSSALVVGANVDDAVLGTLKSVKTFSTATPAATPDVIVGDGASNETQVTRGIAGAAQVVWGDLENANVIVLAISNLDGSGKRTLAAGADDAAFKVAGDDGEVVYMTNTATQGAVHAIHRDAGGDRTILAGGAKDLRAISVDHLVYATAIGTDPALEDLHIIALDGTGDAPLGSGAVDEGFTRDDRYYLWRDNGTAAIGDLHAFDTQTGDVIDIALGVKQLVKASSTKIVSLATDGTLRSTTLGGATTTLSSDVDHVAGLPDAVGGDASRVAYSRASDGIYVADLP